MLVSFPSSEKVLSHCLCRVSHLVLFSHRVGPRTVSGSPSHCLGFGVQQERVGSCSSLPGLWPHRGLPYCGPRRQVPFAVEYFLSCPQLPRGGMFVGQVCRTVTGKGGSKRGAP